MLCVSTPPLKYLIHQLDSKLTRSHRHLCYYQYILPDVRQKFELFDVSGEWGVMYCRRT